MKSLTTRVTSHLTNALFVMQKKNTVKTTTKTQNQSKSAVTEKFAKLFIQLKTCKVQLRRYVCSHCQHVNFNQNPIKNVQEQNKLASLKSLHKQVINESGIQTLDQT